LAATIYDPLDCSGSSFDAGSSAESMQLSAALLIYYILRGRTPLLSQTQGFDSPSVLMAASEGRSGAAFRSLFRHGDAQMALFNSATLEDAFVSALENPDFLFFAWPELNGPEPRVARAAVREAILTGRYSSELSSGVVGRVDALRALSDSLKATPNGTLARKPRTSLSAHLRAAASATPASSPVGRALRELARTRSNQRSAHVAAIRRMQLGETEKKTVLAVVDSCYDLVLGDSLGARETMLRAAAAAPMDIMGESVDDGIRKEGFVSLDSNDVKDLVQVGWVEVAQFSRKVESLSYGERERRAEASELLVRTSSEQGERLGFAPLVDGLYQGAAWGTLGAVGAAATTADPGSAAIAFIAGFLPAFATTVLPARAALQRRNMARLERRFSTLLSRDEGTLKG